MALPAGSVTLPATCQVLRELRGKKSSPTGDLITWKSGHREAWDKERGVDLESKNHGRHRALQLPVQCFGLFALPLPRPRQEDQEPRPRCVSDNALEAIMWGLASCCILHMCTLI